MPQTVEGQPMHRSPAIAPDTLAEMRFRFQQPGIAQQRPELYRK
jgi:hypothetical protein